MNLRSEQVGHLRRVTLAASHNRNILDAAFAADLLDELRDAESDAETRAILLDADGQVFCGGVDPAAALPLEIFTFGRRAAKPLVVAVQGVAVSAGLALIANAHVAVAAQGSSFGLTDVREGRYSAELIEAVSAAIGTRRAVELALTGRVFSAPDALSWGLVHFLTPAFELDDRATSIATALAAADPGVVRGLLAQK